MDCNTARRLLDFARPGVSELEAADLAALEQHLADCPECGPVYRADRRSDEKIAHAMQAIALPAGLRAHLIAGVQAARWAWWRVRLVAAAALVVAGTLATTIGYSYFGRPMLDPAAIAQATYEQTGHWRSLDEAYGIANDWLHSLDRRLSAPQEWNYTYLAFLEHSDFSGLSSVPTFVFTRGDAIARVYVVRCSAFKNLDAFDQPIEAGGCTVAVRRYSEMPGWAFIVVTAGGSIEQFLRPVIPQQPA